MSDAGEIKWPKPPKKHGPVATTLACIAGAFGLLLLIGAIGVGLGGGGVDDRFDAYYTAQQFIKKQYPGAREFARYDDAVVQVEGRVYRVAMEVDGLNAFGGPVRNVVGVEMELDGKTWRLKNIQRR